MEDRDRHVEPVVAQVGVEVAEAVGGGQALVDDRAVRTGRDVQALDPHQPSLDPVGHHLGIGSRRWAPEHGVDHLRAGAPGEFAQHVVVGRGPAPFDQLDRLGRKGGLDGLPGLIGTHEERGHPVARTEDRARDRGEHTRAVGRLGVGGHGTTVLDPGQTPQGGSQDGGGRAALGVGHEADPAGVELSHERAPLQIGRTAPDGNRGPASRRRAQTCATDGGGRAVTVDQRERRRCRDPTGAFRLPQGRCRPVSPRGCPSAPCGGSCRWHSWGWRPRSAPHGPSCRARHVPRRGPGPSRR